MPTATMVDSGEITFSPWPKIHRLYRPVMVTEKIDGTNAAVGVTSDGRVYAQSRKRLITPEQDNHGFAAFVREHADEFRDTLGEGLHFGEWYGPGIGKRYSTQQAPGFGADKKFALFNVKRWADVDLPVGVTTVPLLYDGTFRDGLVPEIVAWLRAMETSPSGTTRPEGLVVYHVTANVSFKITLENDEMSKGEAKTRGLTEYV